MTSRNLIRAAVVCALIVLLVPFGLHVPFGRAQAGRGCLICPVSSQQFENGATLPLSMVNDIRGKNGNICALDGKAGGNKSPELNWEDTFLSSDVKSYVIVMYDVTAAFTHWGMYNISPKVQELPEDAGILGSTYGAQIVNDFGVDAKNPAEYMRYDGPCPPVGVTPTIHNYVFTVYALDTRLRLPSSPNFLANAETLYQALIAAASEGHTIRSSSLGGVYSATPAP
jgi:Raf kinase inhibitor-like YbhB/YbcL family protein